MSTRKKSYPHQTRKMTLLPSIGNIGLAPLRMTKSLILTILGAKVVDSDSGVLVDKCIRTMIVNKCRLIFMHCYIYFDVNFRSVCYYLSFEALAYLISYQQVIYLRVVIETKFNCPSARLRHRRHLNTHLLAGCVTLDSRYPLKPRKTLYLDQL